MLDHHDDELRDEEFPDEADASDQQHNDEADTAQCPQCDATVYHDAVQCPTCGAWVSPADQTDHSRKWWWIALVLAAIVALLAVRVFGS